MCEREETQRGSDWRSWVSISVEKRSPMMILVPCQLVFLHVLGSTVTTGSVAVTFCLPRPATVATGTKRYLTSRFLKGLAAVGHHTHVVHAIRAVHTLIHHPCPRSHSLERLINETQCRSVVAMIE